MDTPKLAVSVIEAARLSSLPERAIWSEIAAGRLRSFKVGRRRLIRVAALDAYLERRELLATGGARPAPRAHTSEPEAGGPIPFPELEGRGRPLTTHAPSRGAIAGTAQSERRQRG